MAFKFRDLPDIYLASNGVAKAGDVIEVFERCPFATRGDHPEAGSVETVYWVDDIPVFVEEDLDHEGPYELILIDIQANTHEEGGVARAYAAAARVYEWLCESTTYDWALMADEIEGLQDDPTIVSRFRPTDDFNVYWVEGAPYVLDPPAT